MGRYIWRPLIEVVSIFSLRIYFRFPHFIPRALRIYKESFIRLVLVFIARIAFTTGERGKEKPPFISGGAGAEDQNRTGDTLIFSQVLYQLSYLGTVRDCTSADRACQANMFICHLKLGTGLP